MSRVLVCTSCRDSVEVYEEPREWIDPALYVCGACLRPSAKPQLELVGKRSERPAFDPSQMAIPF